MSEMKTVELFIKLNDFVSPTVAVFKVPVDTPIDDTMVGHALVQLAEMVITEQLKEWDGSVA